MALKYTVRSFILILNIYCKTLYKGLTTSADQQRHRAKVLKFNTKRRRRYKKGNDEYNQDKNVLRYVYYNARGIKTHFHMAGDDHGVSVYLGSFVYGAVPCQVLTCHFILNSKLKGVQQCNVCSGLH